MEQQKKKTPKIPEGFQAILESLSYDVLKAQPKDVLRFCVDNLSAKLAIELRKSRKSFLSLQLIYTALYRWRLIC